MDCMGCGKKLVQRDNERRDAFNRRSNCNRECGRSYARQVNRKVMKRARLARVKKSQGLTWKEELET